MTDALRLAAPSKGRLQEQTIDYFARAGVKIQKSGRDRTYAGRVSGIPGIELLLLSASEIPKELERGEVHLGVTGEDLVQERIFDWRRKVALLSPLGFGHADLVVATPASWIDVATMADLDDAAARFRARHGRRMRVATKYHRLARRFFTDKGVSDYRLVGSEGATEATTRNLAAEAIIDITSSGETLRANHLRVLDDGLILSSQATLCASLTAEWSAPAREALATLLARMEARSRADKTVDLVVEMSRTAFDELGENLAFLDCKILTPPGEDAVGRLSCPRLRAMEAATVLTRSGAESVRLIEPEMVFTRDAGAYLDFIAQLDAGA